MRFQKKGRVHMQKKRFFALVLMAVVFLLLVGSLVEAAGPLERIDKFFKDNEYKKHDKLIDFLLFFTLFFSVCYLGFSKWFGEGFGRPAGAKNVVIGLSFALSLALAFAVVISTQFSVASLLPIAKNLVFAIIVILFYGIFSNPAMIGNDSWAKKFLSFAMAVAVAYIFLNVFTWGVCNIEGNAGTAPCKSGFFNAAGHGINWLFGGGGGTKPKGNETPPGPGTRPGTGPGPIPPGKKPGPTEPGGEHLQRVTQCDGKWYAYESGYWKPCETAGCSAEKAELKPVTDPALIAKINECYDKQPKGNETPPGPMPGPGPGPGPGQGPEPAGGSDAAQLQAEITALEQELTNAEIEFRAAKDQGAKDVAKGKIQSIRDRLVGLRERIQRANIP